MRRKDSNDVMETRLSGSAFQRRVFYFYFYEILVAARL